MTLDTPKIPGNGNSSGADGASATAPETTQLWTDFASASTSDQFYAAWLALQCQMVGGVRCGLLLLNQSGNASFSPVAVWPAADFDVNHLVPAAEQTLKERRGLLREFRRSEKDAGPSGKTYHVAYPAMTAGRLCGVVVLELLPRAAVGIQTAMQQLHWGISWLESAQLRIDLQNEEATSGRLRKVLDSVADALEHDSFQSSAMAFVTRLATILGCERVSLGFMKGDRIRVSTLSHSAGFGEKANLVRAIETAMEESVDQQALVAFPEPAGAPPLVLMAHENLVRQYGAGSVCSVPLFSRNQCCGALTIEWPVQHNPDESLFDLLRTITLLVGPILELKRQEDRWIVLRIWEKFLAGLKYVVGPRHVALKFCMLLVAGLAAWLFIADGGYRVKAKTVLEGQIQRSICAPFNGYIAAASVRPGDVVEEGSILCRLDERDLRLELAKWSTQKEQTLKEHRGAVAKYDLPQVRILEARLSQAQAEIGLVEEQLTRARVLAPFRGVIMSGDLSQSLGAPVERGQVLFEVAPLESYRVIVQVDERDISEISVGQHGLLVLPSMPEEQLPLTVSTITSVLTAQEGRNYFRVEAQLDNPSGRLRPGMEGVGKIEIGERKLLWIWTHELVYWIRLKLWTWLP